MNSKQQGDIGVAHAIYYYTLNDCAVSIPNTDNTRYDLIVDKDGKLYRVQCKTTFTQSEAGTYVVQLKTSGKNTTSEVKSKFITQDETDLVWVTTKDQDGYEFPVDLIAGRSTLTLGKQYKDYKKW